MAKPRSAHSRRGADSPLRRARWVPRLLPTLVLLLAFVPVPRGGAQAAGTSLVYAQHSCTAAYDAPSTSAHLITQLLGGTEVTLTGTQRTADGAVWDHVKLWSGLDAVIAASDLKTTPPTYAEEGVCTFPGLPDALTDLLTPSTGPWPLAVHGTAAAPTALVSAPSAGAFPMSEVALGTSLDLTGWASDRDGQPWYRVVTSTGAGGWIPVTSVRLSQPDPATYSIGDIPVWHAVAGKGMWFTNYLPHHSDVGALVRAAKLAGLTHVYAEVAISQYGFYARSTLDRLLPAAHAAGLKVIGWVYPTLTDVAADVRLTQAVAAYKTPGGDQVDGIATDVEEVISEPAVYAYGQLLRALLGPNIPMVAAVLHPLSHAEYPYGAIAASWNVLAPMNYWHGRSGHVYAPADVERFVTTSLTTLRAAVGARYPIEELGQMYDMYTDDGAGGADAPTADEIAADLEAAQRLGCVGASYFEWQTATQAEWRVLSSALW
jgi:hypothetical protein